MKLNGQMEDDPPRIQDLDDDRVVDQLRQENERLNDVISSLRMQLNQALEFSEYNEKLMKENSQLKSQLREKDASNDELTRRLEIQLKMIEEKNNNTEKIDSNRIDVSQSLQMIEKERKKYAAQISELNNEIVSKDEIINQIQSEYDNINEQVAKLLSTAQIKYNNVFQSISALSFFIANVDLSENETEHSEEVFNQRTAIEEEYEKQIKRLKRKLDSAKKLLSASDTKIKETKSKYDDVITKQQKEISDLKYKLNDASHNAAISQLESHQETTRHEKDITEYKSQIMKLKQKLNAAEDELKLLKESQSTSFVLIENEQLKKQIQKLQDQLAETERGKSSAFKTEKALKEQLKHIEFNNESLKTKLKNANHENSVKNAEVDSLKCERSSLLLEKASLEETIKSLNTKMKNNEISTQQTKCMIETLQIINEKQNVSITELQKTIDSQKYEIKDIFSERQKIINLVHKQSAAIKAMENNLQKTLENNKALKKKLSASEEKARNLEQRPPEAPPIPVTAWFNPKFPRDLCTQIADYAKNDSLEPSQKLAAVLNVVSSHYDTAIKEQKKRADKAEEDYHRKEDAVDTFLDQLSQIFQSKGENFKLTTEHISNRSRASDEMLDTLRDLVKEKNSIENEKAETESALDMLIAKLEVKNPAEAEQMVTKLYQHIDNLTADLEAAKEKLSSERKSAKAAEKTANQEVSALRSRISSLESDLDEKTSMLEEQSDKLLKSSESFASEREELEARISNMKSQHETDLDGLQTALKEMREQMESVRSESKQSLNAKQTEISRMSERMSELEREKAELQRSLDLAQHTVTEKDDQARALIEQMEENEEQLRERASNEKEQLKKQFEKVLADIKARNADLVQSHSEAAAALSDATNRLKVANERALQLNSSLEDARAKAKNAEEEFDRSRRIAEMKHRTALLQAETAAQSRLEDERAAFQIEKRKIIGFVAQQFRQYFDARQELEESAFRAIVAKAREELERLSRQEVAVRRLLGISTQASIEETIAKIILSMYQTK